MVRALKGVTSFSLIRDDEDKSLCDIEISPPFCKDSEVSFRRLEPACGSIGIGCTATVNVSSFPTYDRP